MLPIKWIDIDVAIPEVFQFSEVEFLANFGSFTKGELVPKLKIFGCGPDDFVCVVEAANEEGVVYKTVTFEMKIW
jgi:hypothetical protein